MNPPSISAIFGMPRSATTWLGSLINSHPDVLYRFEPFKLGLQYFPEQHKKIVDRIVSDDFSEQDLSMIYDYLLPSYPFWEIPPFFAKNFSTKLPIGRTLVYPISRGFNLYSLFINLYTPQNTPKLVFKETSRPRILNQLLVKADVPIIYIVRHPCTVVRSLLEGQEKGVMRKLRENNTEFLTKTKEVFKNTEIIPLIESYESRTDSLSDVQILAFHWLLNVGESIQNADNKNLLIVFYENLSKNTLEVVDRCFKHLNLDFPAATKNFMEESKSNNTVTNYLNKFKRGQIYSNSYFSVFRKSDSSQNNSRTKLSQEQIDEIMQIVKDTEIYRMGAKLANWQ